MLLTLFPWYDHRMTTPRIDPSDRRREFNDFVWNHAADAFQAKFDKCAALTGSETAVLTHLLTDENLNDANRLSGAIRAAVTADRSVVRRLLQIVGLTRNKIIQDIKAYVRVNGEEVSLSSPEAIFNSDIGANLGSGYLAQQIIRVFSHAKGQVTPGMLEALNQATWPGYIRQERAKRMGHEAEYRLACLLRDCGLAFAPGEKAENPLCSDIIIDGMSYDLVSPSATDPKLRIVATVHTANIGQYGESKDDLEIRKAITAMETAGDRGDVTLMAFIDGVGFESNTAGLTGVLANADEFCQFRTIWKAAVIAASKIGKGSRVAIPAKHHGRFKAFCDRYGASLVDRDTLGDAPTGWVEAGDGFIRVNH